MTIERVDHVVLAVRELERATETYTRLLARPPSWRGTHPNGSAATLFRLENTDLELLAPDPSVGDASWLEKRLDEHGEGPFAVAFGTADASACQRALRERGLDAAEPVDGADGSGKRSFTTVGLPAEATHGVPLFAIEQRAGADEVVATDPTGPGAVTRVDHVVIQTPDPEGAIRLYGEQLGLRLALDRTFEARNVRLIFFRVGGLTVEIAASTNADAPTRGSDRFWGVAYGTDDADAARARLIGAGFDMTDTRSGNKAGTRVCTVKAETHGVPTLIIGPGE